MGEMRSLIGDALEHLLEGQVDVALSYSGGTDSNCLLFSLVERGWRPHLYSYCIEGFPSEDLERARNVSDLFDLPLTVCWVDGTVDGIIRDVRKLLYAGIRGKVSIQCMQGHLYVASCVEEPVIVNGSGVDALYGVYRSIILNGARDDKGVFDRLRRDHLRDPNDDAMMYQSALFDAYDIEVVYPYRQQSIVDFLMGLSWREINEPRLKWVTVRDFQDEYQQVDGLYNPRGSQQIMAGTREMHDQLLRSPINRRGRKRVSDVYRDLAEEMGLEW